MNYSRPEPPQGPLQIPLVPVSVAMAGAEKLLGTAAVAYSASPPSMPTPSPPVQLSPVQLSPVQLSLVIPTYNERDNIAAIVRQLTDLLEGAIAGRYELIVVDDNSPDRTWEVAQSLTQIYPHLRVMRRQRERGLSSAVIRGWQISQGNILGVIDADLQHPPDVLLALLHTTSTWADLSVASRHVEGGGVSDWSITRRFLSRGAQLLGLMVCPAVVGRVSDPMSGYFMVRRSAIAGPRLNPLGYKILLEVLGRGSIGAIAEAGYVFQERESGESKVTWKQYAEYIGHLVRLRSSRLRRVRRNVPSEFPLGRFIRYGLVGLSGVFVDMAVFYLLSERVGLGLVLSKVIAAEIAIVSNFLGNDAWTFADVVQQQKSWQPRLKRLLKFNIICLMGLGLDVVLLKLLYHIVFDNRLKYVANLLAIGSVAIWNFWINWKLSWRVTEVHRSISSGQP